MIVFLKKLARCRRAVSREGTPGSLYTCETDIVQLNALVAAKLRVSRNGNGEGLADDSPPAAAALSVDSVPSQDAANADSHSTTSRHNLIAALTKCVHQLWPNCDGLSQVYAKFAQSLLNRAQLSRV